MNQSSSLKKYASIAMVAGLPFLAGIKKTIDYTRSNTYTILTTENTSDKILNTTFSTNPKVLTPEIEKKLQNNTKTEIKESDKIKAKSTYYQHYLPVPDYHVDPHSLTQLTQNRIENNPAPRFVMVNGIEDYKNKNRIRKNLPDACLTHVTGELLRMKMRDKETYQIFGETGKKVRTFSHILEDNGRERLTNTSDQLSYFDDMKASGIVPKHYHDVLKQAQSSQAGDILIFRNAHSNNLSNARIEGDQNATHIVFSRGEVRQNFSLSDLGVSEDELKKYITEIDKKAFLIYRLMKWKSSKGHTRIANINLVSDIELQLPRIQRLLQEYPDLLHVKRESNDISFEGTFITQDLDQKLEAHFLFEFIACNNGTINPICNNSAASGGVFLLTGGLRANTNSTKFSHYNILSPLYKDIYKFRDQLTTDDKILYTHIVFFDDVDKNKNNKIDRYDKTVSEILDDMTEEYYRITYNKNEGMLPSYFKEFKKTDKRKEIELDLKQDIRPYLQFYLEMLGVMNNLPIHTDVPIPYLSEDNKNRILQLYPIYKNLLYEKFDKESQKIYTTYLEEKHKTITQEELQNNPIIVYPFTIRDDKLSLTKQLTEYIDIIIGSHPKRFVNTNTRFGEMSKDEINEVYKLIQGDLTLPEKIDRGKYAFINLPAVLLHTAQYLEFKNKILTNTITPIDDKIIDISDHTADILGIHPTIWSLQKQNIIKESGIDIGRTNIADQRVLRKMIMEKLNMDDKTSLLSNIYYLDSEGILQVRIQDNYLNNNDEMNLIIQAAKTLLDKSIALHLGKDQQEILKELINQIIITKNKNTPNSEAEFNIEREKTKKLLSNIIQLKPSARNDNDIGTLLVLKLDSYTKERSLMRYGRILQNNIGTEQLNTEEVGFLQKFILKAHQLGQTDADKAFKIYMSTFLISRGAMYDKISQETKIQFYQALKKLNFHRKKESKKFIKKLIGMADSNPNWYTDFSGDLLTTIGEKENSYLKEVLYYLNNTQALSETTIPHYQKRRKTNLGPGGKEFEDNESGLYINDIIFTRTELEEFNKYITTLPPNNDLGSASMWFSLAMLGYIGVKYKKKKNIT